MQLWGWTVSLLKKQEWYNRWTKYWNPDEKIGMEPPSPNVNVKQRGVTCHVGVWFLFSTRLNPWKKKTTLKLGDMRRGYPVIQGLNNFCPYVLYHRSFQFWPILQSVPWGSMMFLYYDYAVILVWCWSPALCRGKPTSMKPTPTLTLWGVSVRWLAANVVVVMMSNWTSQTWAVWI